MATPQPAPYGSWKSPITTDLIVAESIGLGAVSLDGEDVFWTEMRPREQGRYVLVRRTADGRTTDLTPAPLSVRTRVHEYGGGAYLLDDGTIYFSNYADQRLYRQRIGAEPEPITPAVDIRYADGVMDHRRRRMICVREDHTIASREAVNAIVAITPEPNDGGELLVHGNDFYSSPRVSPDGKQLAWLTWNHPNMPWDGTELWVGEFDARGRIIQSQRVAGSPAESVFQPEWSPDGVLHFVSDRTSWWNLYRLRNGKIQPLCPMEAEFGRPQWAFGMSTYGFASAERIVCTYNKRGVSMLAILDTSTGKIDPIETTYAEIGRVQVAGDRVAFIGGGPTESDSVVVMNLKTRAIEVLCQSINVDVDPAYISVPRPTEFPTANGLTTHAFYYAPKNPDFVAAESERPPLIVISHGGPTGATSTTLDLELQFWTSRGLAVVDVNYGGSTGYGRGYRQRLSGQWGVVDVEDCVNAARYLVGRDEADPNRLIIRGGSAGGYTTLCALTFRDVFKAGASYFGVSDLRALDETTHKFESRYNVSLVGPYPERADLYRARSPIHFTDQLNCPIIFFQGLEDKIVPPRQSEMMVEAMRKKGLPVAYLAFEGEQHGFRRAETIKRTLDAELYFYSRIFGFALAENVEHVRIENLAG